MKITFINPPVWKGTRPVDRVYGCTYALYPIPNIVAVGYAAVILETGLDADYLDAANERISADTFLEKIRKDQSDVYSFHTTNLSQEIDLKTVREMRRIKPQVWFVFTGPAPTDRPDEFLLDDKMVVARGEADYILRDIVLEIKNGGRREEFKKIKGASFIENGKHVHNVSAGLIEDLDVLPIPARYLLKKGIFYNPKLPNEPVTSMLTSRNCAFQCVFCVPNSIGFAREIEYKRYNNNENVSDGELPSGYGKFIKPPVRKRSAKKVIEEFVQLKKDGYRSVAIADDQFLWEEERTIEICDGIKNLGITWGCLARADRVTEKTAIAMAESGCRYVDFGVESLNPQTLLYINKGTTKERIIEGIKILQKVGIKVKVNMLIGADPNESSAMLWNSIKEITSLHPENIMYSIVSPYPGTKFYEIAKKEGFFMDRDFKAVSVHQKAITDLPNISAQDLEKIIRKANYLFLFNWYTIKQNLWRLGRPKSAISALLAIREKLFS
ncbi:MAG: radical SAM protein [bacterium]|nr:radical SAM protein [bacterium]